MMMNLLLQNFVVELSKKNCYYCLMMRYCWELKKKMKGQLEEVQLVGRQTRLKVKKRSKIKILSFCFVKCIQLVCFVSVKFRSVGSSNTRVLPNPSFVITTPNTPSTSLPS